MVESPRLVSLFIACSDLSRSLDFYEQLGFSILERKSRSVIFSLGGQIQLHLHEPLSPEEENTFGVTTGGGSTCLVQSFEVEDLEELASRAGTRSILFGPRNTTWGQRLLLVADPDGHRLEFRERDHVESSN